nr:hypothetical protein BaRGS_007592 [Batillaria attramentaria]
MRYLRLRQGEQLPHSYSETVVNTADTHERKANDSSILPTEDSRSKQVLLDATASPAKINESSSGEPDEGDKISLSIAVFAGILIAVVLVSIFCTTVIACVLISRLTVYDKDL